MVKTFDLKKASKDLQRLVRDVKKSADQYILKEGHNGVAALISIEDYQKLLRNREEAKKRFFEIVDQVRERNKDIDPQEIATLRDCRIF